MTDENMEILKLLKTNAGVESLLSGGDLFGIRVYGVKVSKQDDRIVKKKKNKKQLNGNVESTCYEKNLHNNTDIHKIKEIDYKYQSIINFETISIDSIPYELPTPLGYEEYEEENWKSPHKLERDLYLLSNVNEYCTNDPFIIKDIQVIPENSIGQPTLSIYQKKNCKLDDDINNEYLEESLIGLEINRGDLNHLGVKLIIPSAYEGYLGRWVVLTIQSTSKLSLVANVNYSFNMAIRVTGCVIQNSLKDGIKKLVSIDAKPFIPMGLLNYFDSSVSILIYQILITI
jgi:hypothetical protein